MLKLTRPSRQHFSCKGFHSVETDANGTLLWRRGVVSGNAVTRYLNGTFHRLRSLC